MDLRAILIAGAPSEPGTETFAQYPFALLDVLGTPLVLRAADRLRQAGMDEVKLVTGPLPAESQFRRELRARPWLELLKTAGDDLWRLCEEIFCGCAQQGAEVVLVRRMGPYVELDYERLLQRHLDGNARLTSVDDASGALGAYVISASRRNDAAFLFRHGLEEFRGECSRVQAEGYVNRLATAADFRRLTHDALFRANSIAPAGDELRPGVHVARGARVERGARLVAPCYIGARAKIRAGAVITRASSVERYAEVGWGAIVEDATLLPFTRLGAGLDCCHALAGFHRLAHVPRQVEIDIQDRRLLASRAFGAGARIARHAAAMAGVAVRALPALLGSSYAPEQGNEPESDGGISPEFGASFNELRAPSELEPEITKARALLRG